MEIFIRIIGILYRILCFILNPILTFIGGSKRTTDFPQINNEMLTVSAVDLAERIRNKEIRSEDVVRAYISRIKEVNPLVNAIVEDRFTEALQDARKADEIISSNETIWIIKNYPLLGVPFTVKESCGLKGLSHTAGSMDRLGVTSPVDAEVVSLLKAAGCIPLAVTNTPEFCVSWESYNHMTGRTLNPYDNRKTSGGSSGGEGAIIGAGASLFGVGSDIAGSIRVPAHFNGIFGHKPTPGVVSLAGHFPNSTDKEFTSYLTVGPMCRYAKDLPTLLHIMAGSNASKLRLDQVVNTNSIKVYYTEDFGFSLAATPVDDDILIALYKAVYFFKNHGMPTEKVDFYHFNDSLEIISASLFSMQDVPDIVKNPSDPTKSPSLTVELLKAMIGQSKYTLAALYFQFLKNNHGFLSSQKSDMYKEKAKLLKKHMVDTLGEDGVLLFPTHANSALKHYDTLFNMYGVLFTAIFNILGMPSTHVPLGFDKNGLPIGIQVIAAPYQDRLCLLVARELEAAFGGWKEPK